MFCHQYLNGVISRIPSTLPGLKACVVKNSFEKILRLEYFGS